MMYNVYSIELEQYISSYNARCYCMFLVNIVDNCHSYHGISVTSGRLVSAAEHTLAAPVSLTLLDTDW